jgi:hypothetical protein
MTSAAAFDSSIAARMVRASKLEEAVYEEVEHDQGATSQAAVVVVTPIFAVIAWAIYAWITYFVGTRLLAGPDTSADWGELARALGFASSPRALLAVAFIPWVGPIIAIAVAVWTLVTTVLAVRTALDFDTWRAVATAVTGWLAYALIVGTVIAVLS